MVILLYIKFNNKNIEKFESNDNENKYSIINDDIQSKIISNESNDNDIWGNDNKLTDRYFFNSNIENDQTKFAKWCYGNSETCKTNIKKCLPY